MSDRRTRSRKIYILTQNERFVDNIQFNIITILNTDESILINQYGKLFTLRDLGEFDLIIEDNFGVLEFFPVDNRPNDYTYAFSSFNFTTDSATGKSNDLLLGDIVKVTGISTTKSQQFDKIDKIVEIPIEYSSSKLEIQVSSGSNYQFSELTILHNNSDIVFNQYGSIFSGPVASNNPTGLGTYYPYFEDNKLFIDFIPNGQIFGSVDFTTSIVSIANTNSSDADFRSIKNIVLSSNKTLINKSIDGNISPVGIGSHGFEYKSSYYIAQCKNLDNGDIQLSEIVVIDSRTQSYSVEYSSLFTGDRVGTFSALKSLDTELIFTPSENNNIDVSLYQLKISSVLEFPDFSNILDLDNLEIISGVNISGVDANSKKDFEIRHKKVPIFERIFNGSNPGIVNIQENTIFIRNHFYVTGEKVNYISDEENEDSTINSIRIQSTSIPGIGVTDRLPKDVYVVKVDDLRIKLSKSAEDALKILPETLNFTSLGSGEIHKIRSVDQSNKALISIDNVIQSPIAITPTQTILENDVSLSDFILSFQDTTQFPSGTFIKINKEIMKILSVSLDNRVIVVRGELGTLREEHLTNNVVRKLKGNYNISNNIIYFTSAPYSLTPKTFPDSPFDERDYFQIQTKSTFDGRVFLRSGVPLGDKSTYESNYILDDITDEFDGISSEFNITSNDQDLVGISTDNGIVLINNIYQSGKSTELTNSVESYRLIENNGKTKIKFTGDPIQNISDINTSGVPYGGVIVSVGSSEGVGYQPLVSAGGTAVIIGGQISQISIGNSGSGYRQNLQNKVNVFAKRYSLGTPNLEIIGEALISNGNIVDVNILNPGSNYDENNPPEIVFDAPIGYTNIPLIYSSKSEPGGIGTEATVDLVVGQGSNIIDFRLNNYGYGYKVGDILTIPTEGVYGIPLNASSANEFSEFNIFVDEIYNMSFSGWTMGVFEELDNLDARFNGKNRNFQLTLGGIPISISKRRGSPLDLEYVLLVFINDILQIPNKDYRFTGSVIRFNTPPKGSNDNPPFGGDKSKIVFYKGTNEVDVKFVEVLDSPKIGDNLKIKSENKLLSQNYRIIESIQSIDSVETNKYSDVGVSGNQNLLRPVKWCKQTDDTYIQGFPVTKDRRIYSPYINPVSFLIKNVNPSDNEIFVDFANLSFNYKKENISKDRLNIIEIISDENYETITNVDDIEGDFGKVVSIESDSIQGISDTCLIFGFFIPLDSYLRDSSINQSISNQGISGIQTGYRFVISGSNSGTSNISFDVNNNQIGNSINFIDNVYECVDYYREENEIIGIGTTTITKVITIVNNFNGLDFSGNFSAYYSWGKINIPSRSNAKEFIASNINGIKQNPIVRRKFRLRSDLYLP